MVTGCVSISVFASLAGIPISITSSAVGLKVCAVNVGFTKYKSKILKKKIKHDKIVLLAKTQLYVIEVLISRASKALRQPSQNFWVKILLPNFFLQKPLPRLPKMMLLKHFQNCIYSFKENKSQNLS